MRLLKLLPPSPRKVITFLREPVARTVSAVHHATRDRAFLHRELDLRGRTVGDLLLDPDAMRFFANTQTSFLSSVDLDRPDPVATDGSPQLSFDTLIPNLACAIRNLEKLGFVGLAEHFTSDLLAVSDLLETYPPKVAPVLNASDRTTSIPAILNVAKTIGIRSLACADATGGWTKRTIHGITALGPCARAR
ncbi:MAG: hypothetical protein ACYCS1_09335, partial [Gammaproteobacteria bacterium]